MGFWARYYDVVNDAEQLEMFIKTMINLNVRVENINDCIKIEPGDRHSEVIYTTAPANWRKLKTMLYSLGFFMQQFEQMK